MRQVVLQILPVTLMTDLSVRSDATSGQRVKGTWCCFLAGVVKNNSHRIPVTGVESANAMPHIHTIDAVRSLDGAIVHSKRDRVALS